MMRASTAGLFLCCAITVHAQQVVGSITALLPAAEIERGTGAAHVVIPAKQGEELRRFDIVRTNRGGRARITLSDQSILSLGSQAELKIVQADMRLRDEMYVVELRHGRLRVELSKYVRMKVVTPGGVGEFDGGSFGVDGESFSCSYGKYRYYRLGHDDEAEMRSCTNDAPPTTAPPPPADR